MSSIKSHIELPIVKQVFKEVSQREMNQTFIAEGTSDYVAQSLILQMKLRPKEMKRLAQDQTNRLWQNWPRAQLFPLQFLFS